MDSKSVETINEIADSSQSLEKAQYAERKFGSLEIIGGCAFSSSLAVLVRKNMPQSVNYNGESAIKLFEHDSELQVIKPSFFNKLKVAKISLKDEKDGYMMALPFRIRWRVEIGDNSLQYLPTVLPGYGGINDKNILNDKSSKRVKENIIRALHLKPKTIEPPITTLPTAPWDEMIPEDTSEYMIKIVSVPYACFQVEVRSLVEPFINQIKEAVKQKGKLPNTPWFAPDHQAIYTSPLNFIQINSINYPNDKIEQYLKNLQNKIYSIN